MRSAENGAAGRGLAPSREGLMIRTRNGKGSRKEEKKEKRSHYWEIISEDEQKAERI